VLTGMGEFVAPLVICGLFREVDGSVISVVLTARAVDYAGMTHYLTRLSFGFAFLAAGEAFREAFARIAPAAFFDTPSFLAILF